MNWISRLAGRATQLSGKRRLPFIFALLFALVPGFALASGGENVVLNFTSSDMIYLYISLGFGAIAVIFGLLLRGGLMSQSPGNEKMQEVGAAIRDGALAYLRKQIGTMAIFVVALAIGLVGLYYSTYGIMTAVYVALSFVAGVIASYVAGYAGMLMAVSANMRTAHAALTSYKTSLEIAFRSGAVAGLFTVGLGLIGATLIFLFGGRDAMKLLVGFGFGGSLAALFMRVGGGIYTKAADVGADLVGKVEAGIPEDDARNPATIADNVGDNVGDCAGMAADIFESYEVTLVAAIILGAATAAIFDQATWMKLVLFALMARGVGIVASIIGIYAVKGSDNVDTDPLKLIKRGFTLSAFIAAVLTTGLAWYMMGGQPNQTLMTSKMTPTEAFSRNEMELIQKKRDQKAKELNKQPYEIVVADIAGDEDLKYLELEKPENAQVFQMATMTDLENMPKVPEMAGYSKIDFNDENSPVANYSAMNVDMDSPQPKTEYKSLREVFGKKETVNGKEVWVQKPTYVYKLNLITPAPVNPTERGKPPAATQKPTERQIFFGPIDEDTAKKQIEMVQKQGTMTIKELAKYPAALYANREGKIIVGFDNPKGDNYIARPHTVQGAQNMMYWKEPADALKKMDEARRTDFSKPFPPGAPMKAAVVEHQPVAWYLFAICIIFGIGMAFAIEWLTDYYVSTHKKPVKEVANVSSTGPAPMIIQGFAYGAESSVFSVFAIVVALIAPLLIFNPANYGSYILSFYGIALVGLGLLTTTGFILAMDTFGPISDNAQGVFEMSGAGHDNPQASKAVQRLDAAGNTTKALTKGFAIATAVVAAVALFHTYVESAMLTGIGLQLDVPEIFLGLMIGGAAPYLFSAFSINAVGRASFQLINEVRRQFRADPGIMAGTSKPDYGRCVAIVTQAAQKELLGPGILAIAMPALVGFGLSIGKTPVSIGGNLYNLTGAQALGGFLAGAILSGQLMAVLLANSGGMWDNAKKLIEDGLYGGKGTEAHKAGVVCDTVGDPFKDTAGPALNPLIKVMNLVALLLAPVVIMPFNNMLLIGITLGAAILLLIAILWSKRGSMSTALTMAQSEAGAIGAGGSAAPKSTPDSESEKQD